MHKPTVYVGSGIVMPALEDKICELSYELDAEEDGENIEQLFPHVSRLESAIVRQLRSLLEPKRGEA